jgi:fatty acid desaturase
LDTGFLARTSTSITFPTIPWYRYRRAYDEIAPGIRAEGGEVRSLRQVLASLPPRLSRGLVFGRRSS